MFIVSRDKITKGTLGGKPFLYNPTEFSDSTKITYNEVKTCGMSYPAFVYGGGEARVVSFVLYLNDQKEPGITKSYIRHLHSFLPPERKKGYQFKSPKTIMFSFGWYVKECLLEGLDANYLAFSPTLEPIEAEVTVTLKLVI